MDITKFRTDEEKERKGVWIPIGDGAELLIARWGNPEMVKTSERLMEPPEIKQAYRHGALSEEKALEINIETMAESILLDWRGLEEKGKSIQYSKAKAIELLRIKDFCGLVTAISKTQENFRAQVHAEGVDNLKKT